MTDVALGSSFSLGYKGQLITYSGVQMNGLGLKRQPQAEAVQNVENTPQATVVTGVVNPLGYEYDISLFLTGDELAQLQAIILDHQTSLNAGEGQNALVTIYDERVPASSVYPDDRRLATLCTVGDVEYYTTAVPTTLNFIDQPSILAGSDPSDGCEAVWQVDLFATETRIADGAADLSLSKRDVIWTLRAGASLDMNGDLVLPAGAYAFTSIDLSSWIFCYDRLGTGRITFLLASESTDIEDLTGDFSGGTVRLPQSFGNDLAFYLNGEGPGLNSGWLGGETYQLNGSTSGTFAPGSRVQGDVEWHNGLQTCGELHVDRIGQAAALFEFSDLMNTGPLYTGICDPSNPLSPQFMHGSWAPLQQGGPTRLRISNDATTTVTIRDAQVASYPSTSGTAVVQGELSVTNTARADPPTQPEDIVEDRTFQIAQSRSYRLWEINLITLQNFAETTSDYRFRAGSADIDDTFGVVDINAGTDNSVPLRERPVILWFNAPNRTNTQFQSIADHRQSIPAGVDIAFVRGLEPASDPNIFLAPIQRFPFTRDWSFYLGGYYAVYDDGNLYDPDQDRAIVTIPNEFAPGNSLNFNGRSEWSFRLDRFDWTISDCP